MLPNLDPARFIWFRAGGDLELHLMLVDEPPPRAAALLPRPSTTSTSCARGIEAAGVETRDGTELVGRPRFICRDPFGNLSSSRGSMP